MLKVTFDIIKSEDEEHLDKLEPSIEILESADLALQAWLLFFKRYEVPSTIRLGTEPLRKGQRGCRQFGALEVSMHLHLNKPRKLHVTDVFTADVCNMRCPECAIYFDTRKDPVIYHKYVEIFNQIGKDIISAYNCTITSKRTIHSERREIGKTSLTFSLCNDDLSINTSTTNQELTKVPSRRIRIE